MGQSVDLGGEDLYVNAIYTGNTGPNQLVKGGSANVDNVTTSTFAPSASQTGNTIILNVATTTVTLPAPVVGLTYTFVVGTAATAQKVITNAGTVFLSGSILTNKAGVVTGNVADGSTDVSINLNGTTKGGFIGDTFTVTCVSTTEWGVSGICQGSGTLASPFGTS